MTVTMTSAASDNGDLCAAKLWVGGLLGRVVGHKGLGIVS